MDYYCGVVSSAMPVHLSFFLLLFTTVLTPASSQEQPPPDYGNAGGDQYNRYGGGAQYGDDYGVGGDAYDGSYYVPEVLHQCYVCTYEVYSDNTEQGFRECRDPFDGRSISKIDCAYPCSKTYEKIGEKEFEIRRACMPSCKEDYRVNYYRQCCDEHLCNGASGILPVLRRAPVTLVTLCTLMTSYLAWLLRR